MGFYTSKPINQEGVTPLCQYRWAYLYKYIYIYIYIRIFMYDNYQFGNDKVYNRQLYYMF